MVIGYRASRRPRLVARAPAARSWTMYQITQLKGKNSPLSHAKRQRWPRRRAPQAASEPTASQTADRPSVQMPAALTPQHYRAPAGGAALEHSSKSRQPPAARLHFPRPSRETGSSNLTVLAGWLCRPLV